MTDADRRRAAWVLTAPVLPLTWYAWPVIAGAPWPADFPLTLAGVAALTGSLPVSLVAERGFLPLRIVVLAWLIGTLAFAVGVLFLGIVLWAADPQPDELLVTGWAASLLPPSAAQIGRIGTSLLSPKPLQLPKVR